MSDFFGVKKIFNRVFNGENVFCARVVDTVNHRGERGGLTLPHRPHNEKEPLLALGEDLQYRGEVQLGERVDVARHEPGARARSPCAR